MSGWAKLGEALAGTSDARRADIEAKTINALASRDANVARAKMAMSKARDQAALGDYFREIGIDNPEAMAGVGRSGVNLNTLTGGVGNMQEQRFRQAAVDAAGGGDYGAANAQLMGVANAPVEIPKVAGGMLLSNRLVPGGGTATVTPVGQSTIDRNAVTGEAAMIRANRAPVSRGGGSASGSGKLSQVQAARMKSELADIKARKEVALGIMESNAGASNPAAVANAAKAEQTLKALQAEESAIFDKYEGGGGLGSRVAPPNEVNGVTVPEGFTPETFQHAIAINLDRRKQGLPDLTESQMQQFRKTGELRESVAPREASSSPPVPGARKSPKDGLWYIPDPSRPGKYLRVDG